jgi:hypothetical protein
MKFLSNQRFLAIYSGVLTITIAVTVLGGFAAEHKKTDFEEINVQRINLVEPDGTLRMVISDKALAPGIYLHGKEHPHPDRKTAGMIFLNEEGTENGGLIFGGEKEKDGKTSSFGHLSFDAYEQDQLMSLDSGTENENQAESITFVDRPNYAIGELIDLTDRIKEMPKDKQQAEIAQFMKSHPSPHQRVYLGRGADKTAALKLKDLDGHDRIVMQVAADGTPTVKFLDAGGKVVSQMPSAEK